MTTKQHIASYLAAVVCSSALAFHMSAALYPAPVATPAVPTAAGQADLIKQEVAALGDSVMQQYTVIKGNVTAPGVTRAQTIAALGSDASPLNTVATNIRTLLASIDAALGTKYDTVGAP